MQLQINNSTSDTWKIQLSGRNLEQIFPKAWEAEKIPVRKPKAAALFDGSTTAA